MSPCNWVVHEGAVSLIDVGQDDLRTAAMDLFRRQSRTWRGRPDLEHAFLDGYGVDPRGGWWQSTVLAELIGVAVWAHQVGDGTFEA